MGTRSGKITGDDTCHSEHQINLYTRINDSSVVKWIKNFVSKENCKNAKLNTDFPNMKIDHKILRKDEATNAYIEILEYTFRKL